MDVTSRAKSHREGTEPGSAIERYILQQQLGFSGKDKAVYKATDTSSGALVAIAVYHKNKGKTILTEAAFQRRAAEAGLAAHVHEIDSRRRRLVFDLLPGGTLIQLAQRQDGRLMQTQQERILHLLRAVGKPVSAGGAYLRHADAGNPANYVADTDGTLHLVDFSPPHCREMRSTEPSDANMGSLGMLLWHHERGLLRRGWVTDPPLLLLREYRLFCRRPDSPFGGAADPMDPDPDWLPQPPSPTPKGVGTFGGAYAADRIQAHSASRTRGRLLTVAVAATTVAAAWALATADRVSLELSLGSAWGTIEWTAWSAWAAIEWSAQSAWAAAVRCVT